jgi:DUF3024 family protein
MTLVTAAKEYQALFSRWCAQRVPQHARDRWQVGYRIHGDEVTIVERHPPCYPELESAWSTTRVAQLRHNDPDKGLWRIYVPSDAHGGGWRRYDYPPTSMPEPLLDEIADDPSAIFWG